MKLWSKPPWCSQGWDKLLDERNHIQKRSLREEDSLFIYMKIKGASHELGLFFFSWVIGKNNPQSWKRKVVFIDFILLACAKKNSAYNIVFIVCEIISIFPTDKYLILISKNFMSLVFWLFCSLWNNQQFGLC